jgi:hypothetical protein
LQQQCAKKFLGSPSKLFQGLQEQNEKSFGLNWALNGRAERDNLLEELELAVTLARWGNKHFRNKI